MTNEPTTFPPFAGVDPREWNELLADAADTGTVHAEAVTHVLRHIVLDHDTLVEVQQEFERRGITIDDAVEDIIGDHADDTPASGQAAPAETPAVSTGDTHQDTLARRRERRVARMAEKHETTATGDTVRMYLKEIGRVSPDRRRRTTPRSADRGRKRRRDPSGH
ncbi:MAG: hypothetical protein R2715_13685 [Ilumatobacteraceae bacterium]